MASMKFGKQTGFSLVELMVSMTIGLTLMAGMMSMFTGTLKNSNDFVSLAKLDQDLQGIMDFVAKEVRRAGFDNNVDNNGDGQTDDAQFGISGSSTSSCLIYTYDNDKDGVLAGDNSESFGIKYDSTNQEILFKSSVTSCSATNWSAVNDKNTVLITGLTFTDNSLCVNLSDNSNCRSGTSGYVSPSSGDKLIWKKQIDITLKGKFKNDTANYERTVKTTVRSHNDILVTK